MRWVLAIVVLAAIGVAVVRLWPQSKLELPAEPLPSVVPSAVAGLSPVHKSSPAGLAPGSIPVPAGPTGLAAPVGTAPPAIAPPVAVPSSDPARGSPLGGAVAPGADAGRRFETNKDGIRAAVGAGVPEIKDCFDQWLKLQPALAGKLKVSFTISSDDAGGGIVSAVSIGDAGMGHVAMEGCVLQVFQELRFEDPGAAINVTYPIVFVSDADGGP